MDFSRFRPARRLRAQLRVRFRQRLGVIRALALPDREFQSADGSRDRGRDSTRVDRKRLARFGKIDGSYCGAPLTGTPIDHGFPEFVPAAISPVGERVAGYGAMIWRFDNSAGSFCCVTSLTRRRMSS